MVGVVPKQGKAPMTPIPADPPISGPLWSVVVPALLLAVAVAATVLLYRHFARRSGTGAS